MTTRFPGPIRRVPDPEDAFTICRHVFFVLLAAGAAAYVVARLDVMGHDVASLVEETAFNSRNSLRQIAWVFGAIVGIVWRYRIWSKDRSELRQDGETDLAAKAAASLREAKERAREAALAEDRKPSRAIEAFQRSRRSPGMALGSAFRAAGAGCVFGLVAGVWVGIPLAIAVWSISLSPLAPAEWADFAMSLTTREEPVVLIGFAVILGFAALGALLLFVLDLIPGATVEAGSKDGDTT